MKQTSPIFWLSLLLAAGLSGCGSEFAATGVSTGGTGDRVPDLGEDDFSLPNDASLERPNPPVAANQANQPALLATDVIWPATNWRLQQSDQALLILPDLRVSLPTQLGQKSEGIIFDQQIAVIFGSDASHSYYQVLSTNTDGEPQLSAPVRLTGRVLQARLSTDSLSNDSVLDLLLEDYTGLDAEVGSYRVRSTLRDGALLGTAQRTRLATRPLASTQAGLGIAWIGANKGGNQWLYLIDCKNNTSADCTALPPVRLSGKLATTATQQRHSTPALFIQRERIYLRIEINGQTFVDVYQVTNGQLRRVDLIRSQGTATLLATPATLTAQSKAVLSSRVFLGGGNTQPALVNSVIQPSVQATSATWRSLRAEQTDQQLLFYPNTFASTPLHRITLQGKAEGLFATENLLIALQSNRQDTHSTLIAPHNNATTALSTSTSRMTGRVEHLRIQQNPAKIQIDELINLPQGSESAAVFARSPVDAITKTKGSANLTALPHKVLASASSEDWMVWVGQDADQKTWIYPIICQADQARCDHPEPVQLQGNLSTDTEPMRQQHSSVRIVKDRLFVYVEQDGVAYLDLYLLAPTGLGLIRRIML